MKRKVTIFNIVENEIHDKRFPVTTACRVLRLRMEEPPPIWRVAANILTGHGPHFLLFSLTSLIVIFCILFSYSVYFMYSVHCLCILCNVLCKCVLDYCHRVRTQLQLKY